MARLLSPEQQDSLARYEARYRTTLDSIYRPLADYLAGLPNRYDGAEALNRVQQVDSLAWDVTYEAGPKARATLSALQLTIVPEFMRRLLTDTPEFMRRTHTRYEISASPQGTSFSIYRR